LERAENPVSGGHSSERVAKYSAEEAESGAGGSGVTMEQTGD